METKKSKRRQMATLLCSLGAIVIGGVAADAWADYVTTNGQTCWLVDTNGTKTIVVDCNGTSVVTKCGVDANGNAYGECGQRNGFEV